METLAMILLGLSWFLSLALAFMCGFGAHAKMIQATICSYSEVLKGVLNKVSKVGNDS